LDYGTLQKISNFNLASKRLINIDLVDISFAFALLFTKTIILLVIYTEGCAYLDHLLYITNSESFVFNGITTD